MPTRFSIDEQLDNGLRARGMPVVEFSKVALAEGIARASKTRLFEAFRDTRPLDNELAQQLWALWQEIDEMAKSFEPFRLDLSLGSKVHEWLGSRRRSEVYSVVVSGLDTEDK
jgi:hypothetical protein